MRPLREIVLSIESRLDHVALVGEAAGAAFACFGFAEAVRAELELCVVEAVSNSIRHAYRGEAGRPVTVRIRGNEAGVEVRVLDEGLPVPHENRTPREPDWDPADLASIPEGGRGVFLIHSLMDSVAYEQDGAANVLVMKKAHVPHPET